MAKIYPEPVACCQSQEAYRPILKDIGLVWIGHILHKEKKEDRDLENNSWTESRKEVKNWREPNAPVKEWKEIFHIHKNECVGFAHLTLR